MTDVAALWARAARCYRQVELLDDACRCFEQAGAHASAADLHERQQRWAQAALGYAAARRWSAAASCHLRAGQAEAAAECWLQADEPLQAAWALAEHAHRFERASALVLPLAPSSPGEEVLRTLVLARCESGRATTRRSAARHLRSAAGSLSRLGPGPMRERALEWAQAVARSLARPDLAAALHAAAVGCSALHARERWEAWATAALGDATGVPLDEGIDAQTE